MRDWAEVVRWFTTDAVAHVATLQGDGAPHVVPVWVDAEGETDLAFFSVEGSRKDRNTARDPRVALSVTAPANALSMATVRGEVVRRVGGEDAMAIVDRISRAYTGGPYQQRTGLVAFVVRPTSWWAQDYAEG